MNAAHSSRDISEADSTPYNRPLPDKRLVACPHCDLLQRLPEVAPGASARCPRCDKELWRHREDSLNRTLALTLAAAVLYVIANAVPMLGLTAVGHQAATTVFGGAVQLWRDGQEIVAVLILFAAVVAPALQIGSMLLITAVSLRERPPAWVGALLRHIPFTRTWSMLEVMLVGVPGRADQDRGLCDGGPGAGAVRGGWTGLPAPRDPVELRPAGSVGQGGVGGSGRPAGGLRRPDGGGDVVSPPAITAIQQGLQSCEGCGLLSRPAPGAEEGRCPRCDEELRFRKRDSLQRTLAFLIAAAICYLPANLLPVMTTITAGGEESDTIMQGVVLLWSPTGWPLSLIVLFASIMIPSAKILALLYLVFTVRRGSIENNRQRVRLYRIVDIIGRWSMVDVFVDTFTVALIQLQPLMSVKPAPGVLFFAAVVVLTMLAVESFDPRLIWDPQVNTDGHR